MVGFVSLFSPEADDCLKLLTGQLFGCFFWNVRENGPAARYGPHINGLFFQSKMNFYCRNCTLQREKRRFAESVHLFHRSNRLQMFK